ncbi:zinc-dependent alcohol dehydrogenase family protein [Acetilactobacillus jinshanensis]|uniref:Alcohol dehydrogenase n=1 Tax=Acetilactobacillus jinshanensis TaxID=1720083 RepID=A0A4P6ZJY8_9LACO|nr:zinc-dependent alcohol dehydrogenase family protein [Acetilactobacillus jinshanensis]QBP18065.1 zinc-binding alcohol dehydrogenase family protein [Acetilactobacillus jinshanensis]URL60928.1 zinc-dependent alcohol dehydrogenase family protein [uncultured bacterium]
MPAIPKTMKAWEVVKQGSVNKKPFPLKYVTKPVPQPKPGETLVKVLACGVCHTDLHVTEGDLPVHKKLLTPGHEIVGIVVKNGKNAHRFKIGDRIGIPWLRWTCGVCEYCRSGHENLCPNSKYTGWDHDGGYAQYATVPEGYAYHIPKRFKSVEAAPLLCAGIIGYRAYERANVPAGGKLGLYGFGGSAHITAQIALAQGIQVHVFTRGGDAGRYAKKLGCSSVNNTYDVSPVPLDSSIIYAPVGDCVPNALKSLRSGGTLALAGIHMTDIPQMSYEDHIFHEKTLTSVESNTRHDGETFLTLADRLGIQPHVTTYPLDKADQALKRVSKGDLKGACVLKVADK